jgi:hypothetical protein
MTRETCNRCNRPFATQEDFDDPKHPPGCVCASCEGLCWDDSTCASFDWKGRAATLEAENERLRVYETQCNELSQKFYKSLIVEGVPAALEYIEHLLKEFERMQLMADEQRKRAILAEDAARSLHVECEGLSAGCCEHLVGDPFGNGTCKYRERFSNLRGQIEDRDRQIEILTERADRGCHSGCLEHPDRILSTSHHPDCKKEAAREVMRKFVRLRKCVLTYLDAPAQIRGEAYRDLRAEIYPIEHGQVPDTKKETEDKDG